MFEVIDAYLYKKRSSTVKKINDMEEMVEEMYNPNSQIWVNFHDPTDEELHLLEKKFGFHPLTVEDVFHGKQRPKMENYEKYAFIVIRTLDRDNACSTCQLSFFIGDSFIVTINKRPIPAVQKVIDRCMKNPLILKRGVDFLLYNIMDAVIDDMFPVIANLENKIEEVERKIFTKATPSLLKDLFKLKRQTLMMRKVVWPVRDIFNVLARRDTEFIRETNVPYFRDIYDHVIRQSELIDSSRELITGSVEGYLSIVSNDLNVAMKKLAAIAAVIMVPTLIAGIYGMNFKAMPEIAWEYGYYFSLALMALAVGGLLWYFRKVNWI